MKNDDDFENEFRTTTAHHHPPTPFVDIEFSKIFSSLNGYTSNYYKLNIPQDGHIIRAGIGYLARPRHHLCTVISD